MSSIGYVLIALALVIIVALGYYAGSLLFQLRQQNIRQQAARRARADKLIESIQTIAMAVQQQQCNLSEGAIRLVNLIESVPVQPAIQCRDSYPALYELFGHVKDLPTHEKRKALSAEERNAQDQTREEHESRLESDILKEVTVLRKFSVVIR